MNATTRTIHNGQLYVSATSRGTEYCLQRLGDGWFVSSRRLALGRHNVGSGRHFATLADVAAGCKAFGSADDLAAAFYGLNASVAA